MTGWMGYPQVKLHRKMFRKIFLCCAPCFSLDLLHNFLLHFVVSEESTTHFSTSPLILKMTKITTHSHYSLRDAPSLLNLNQGIMSQSMGNVIRLYSLKWPLILLCWKNLLMMRIYIPVTRQWNNVAKATTVWWWFALNAIR